MKKSLLYSICFIISICIYGQSNIKLETAQTTGVYLIACNSINLLPGFSFAATSINNMDLKVDPSLCDIYAGAEASTSGNVIYIRARTYTNEDGTRYLDAIQYYDNFGRPVQNVQRGISPAGADLVTLQEYDFLGRDSKTWLPAVVAGNNGAFLDETNLISKATTSYNDQNPFTKIVYEMSASNRILAQYGPGQDWHKTYGSDSKAVRTDYMANASSGVLLCAEYICNNGANLTITKKGNYAAGELFVIKMTDEDGNISYEFKDKQGQIILTRQMNGTIQYDTYYIYDNFGNLRSVLPPLASDALTATNTTWSETTTAVINYTYLYKYDGRNRCVAKKLPGAEWIYYVYDKADRLIFTQDGEQRAKGEWAFTIPDTFGRVVLSGTCKNSIPNTTANPYYKYLWNVTVKAESPKNSSGVYTYAGTYKGYNLSGVTLTTATCLAVNYYDGYEFLSPNGLATNGAYNAETGYGAQYTGGYKGLLTGTLTAQMKSDGTIESAYLYSVMYYDNRGRLIQAKSNNHLTGGLEKEYIAYNFTGQPTQKKHVHSATGKNTQTEVYAYTYDHAGRLLKTTHQLTDGTTVKPQVILAENTYDELGRLKTNKKNNQANLTTTYIYNVRSWTKSISSPLFTQTLYYNESYGGSTKQYNGNISAISWKHSDESATRGYSFAYDNLSRLTTATYLQNAAANNNYKSSYSYDKHGNMKTLQRYGLTAASTYGIIDNLTMNHTGNQLTWVNDAAADISYAPSADYKDKKTASGTIEYTYNKNGAMSKDDNKGITEIQYNSLNLPRQMVINSASVKAKNYYTYSASGVKLKTEQRYDPALLNSPIGTTTPATDGLTDYKNTDYAGNIIYETMKSGSTTTNKTRILIDGGYIENNAYYFYLNDHLGNNRVVTNASGTVTQKNHYYPFGTTFAESTSADAQPYKYNGKELDKMHGLNLYDYSARYYESVIGRFTTVDPRAEKYYSTSPYVYCLNNPMLYIDPRGDTARVYIETVDYGHTWMSVGEGDDMTVYTYALNGNDTNIGFAGKGVMSKYTGVAAQNYLDKKKNTNYTTYAITDVTDEAVGSYLDNILNASSDIVMQEKGVVADTKDGKRRIVDATEGGRPYSVDERNIDIYTPTNNCATFVSKALNGSGSSVFPITTTYMPSSISAGTWTSYSSGRRDIYRIPVNMGRYFDRQINAGSNILKKR